MPDFVILLQRVPFWVVAVHVTLVDFDFVVELLDDDVLVELFGEDEFPEP